MLGMFTELLTVPISIIATLLKYFYVTSTIVSTLYYQRPAKLLCLVCNSA